MWLWICKEKENLNLKRDQFKIETIPNRTNRINKKVGKEKRANRVKKIRKTKTWISIKHQNQCPPKTKFMLNNMSIKKMR